MHHQRSDTLSVFREALNWKLLSYLTSLVLKGLKGMCPRGQFMCLHPAAATVTDSTEYEDYGCTSRTRFSVKVLALEYILYWLQRSVLCAKLKINERRYYPFEDLWSLYVPPGLTFTYPTFCPHCVFTCFMWISEQTAIISLGSTDWLIFITETDYVYCAVRAEYFNIKPL